MSDPALEKIMNKKMEDMAKRGNNKHLDLSERNFEDIIAGNKPILVDFWASWCGPCQFMLPIFDKLAQKYAERIVFARLNVDNNQSVAARFDVYAIPTFIVFKEGRPIDRAIGAVGEGGLESMIKKHI